MKDIIYKVTLGFEPKQRIWIQQFSTILSVNSQKNNICLWYRCNAGQLKEYRTIHIYGTGHELIRSTKTR